MKPDRIQKNKCRLLFGLVWLGYLVLGCLIFRHWFLQGVNLTGLAWQHGMLLGVMAYCLPAVGCMCLLGGKAFAQWSNASFCPMAAGNKVSFFQHFFLMAGILMGLGLLIPYQNGWLGQLHILVCTIGVSMFLLPWLMILILPNPADKKLKKNAAGVLPAALICTILCAWSGQISLEAELFFLWSIPLVLGMGSCSHFYSESRHSL